MKKVNIFIGTGIAIVVIGLIIFWVNSSQFLLKEETRSFQENLKQEVILIIDEGEGSPEEIRAEFREGMTAFDLLKNKTEELNIGLKTKTYDIGIFIEAIGVKENGQSGKYWLYYVNGEMPPVGADKKALNPGDKVEFKFETSPF